MTTGLETVYEGKALAQEYCELVFLNFELFMVGFVMSHQKNRNIAQQFINKKVDHVDFGAELKRSCKTQDKKKLSDIREEENVPSFHH